MTCARFAAAAMSVSAGDMDGFVRYLCLKNTVAAMRVVRPYFPAPVVFGRCTNDPSFGAVLGLCFASGGFVMDKGFDSDGNDRHGIGGLYRCAHAKI